MIINQDFILVIQMNPGLTMADVSVKLKSPSSIIFVPVPFTDIGDFQPAEGDYYNIKIKKEYITELGDFIIIVTNPFVVINLTEECLPYYGTPEPNLCIVYGNVRDVGGSMPPYMNIPISVYPVKLPEIRGGIFTLGQRLTVYADYNGNFNLPLLIGATVVFELPDAGMRLQAVIPDQATVALSDLVPTVTPGVTVK